MPKIVLIKDYIPYPGARPRAAGKTMLVDNAGAIKLIKEGYAEEPDEIREAGYGKIIWPKASKTETAEKAENLNIKK